METRISMEDVSYDKDKEEQLGGKERDKVGKADDENDEVEYHPVCREWQKIKCDMIGLELVTANSVRHGLQPQMMHSKTVPHTENMQGDGNCLFRALSHIVCGDQVSFPHHMWRSGILGCVISLPHRMWRSDISRCMISLPHRMWRSSISGCVMSPPLGNSLLQLIYMP